MVLPQSVHFCSDRTLEMRYSHYAFKFAEIVHIGLFRRVNEFSRDFLPLDRPKKRSSGGRSNFYAL